MSLPEVTKTRVCVKCRKETAQTLKPCRTGAEWHCKVCSMVLPGYTLGEMSEILKGIYTPASARPIGVDLTKVKVFLAHPDGEFELNAAFVKKHVEITGELPVKGKPVMAYGPLGSASLGSAVPYGIVTRVVLCD